MTTKRKRNISTAIRFDPDIHAKLIELSEGYGLSVNWLVNRCLRLWWNDFYTGIVSGLGHQRIPTDAEAEVERP